MSEQQEESEKVFRKIVVAVDASSHSRSALRTAVNFARRFNAHMSALFVEDENILRAATHGHLSEVNSITGQVTNIPARALDKHIKRTSTKLRRLIELIGDRADIDFSYRSIRGDVAQTLKKVSDETDVDLVTIGRMSQTYGDRGKLGTAAKHLLEHAEKPVMLLHRNVRPGSGIVLVYDPAYETDRLVDLARKLVGDTREKLTIISTSDRDEAGPALKDLIDSMSNAGIPFQINHASTPDAHDVALSISRLQPALVLASRGHRLFQDQNLKTIVKHTKSPLLLPR